MGTLLTIVLAGLLIWATIHLYSDVRKVRNWQVDPAVSLNLLEQDSSLDVSGPIDAAANGLIGVTEKSVCHAVGEAGSCDAAGVSIGHVIENLGHFIHH
jgi:hypothetical protein